MKGEQDYIRDITEMRSMMERSSKFLSLSGWAGILAGVYALTGAYIAYDILNFNPAQLIYADGIPGNLTTALPKVIFLASIVLVLAVATAVFLSYKKAKKRREKIWNPTARRVLINMAVPLIAGGLLVLILISEGFIGLVAPLTLLFYGLALFNTGKFTYEEVKSLGLIDAGLGLVGCYRPEFGLMLWALGFGIVHIIYGVYIHYRYER